MKILVIGATGGTGRLIVRRLLANGGGQDSVRAFARNPADLADLKDSKLDVVKGDARDAASIDRAVSGVDAVVVAFGPRSLKKDDLQETLDRHLTSAMRKHGVKRVVNLSAWGAGDSVDKSGFLFSMIRSTLLRNVYADKNRGESILLDPTFDYVNVRPGRLIDKPARGGVKASLDGDGIKKELTREDLAAFMVEQLRSDTWVKRSPLIGY